MFPNLNDQKQFRLNKINKEKYYFVTGIKEIELMSKKKFASFDYFDKLLIAFSATTGSICIASFSTVIGAALAKESAMLSPAFWISTGIVKKLLKTTRDQKKEHNKIFMLASGKLNSVESKIFEALINNENSQWRFYDNY